MLMTVRFWTAGHRHVGAPGTLSTHLPCREAGPHRSGPIEWHRGCGYGFRQPCKWGRGSGKWTYPCGGVRVSRRVGCEDVRWRCGVPVKWIIRQWMSAGLGLPSGVTSVGPVSRLHKGTVQSAREPLAMIC